MSNLPTEIRESCNWCNAVTSIIRSNRIHRLETFYQESGCGKANLICLPLAKLRDEKRKTDGAPTPSGETVRFTAKKKA